MSILSDEEITERCLLPDTILDEAAYNRRIRSGIAVPAIHYYNPADEKAMYDGIYGKIREECMIPTPQHVYDAFVPMISPFKSESVRVLKEKIKGAPIYVDGEMLGNQWEDSERKIISAGLSSYGYDVTLAEEFKIFTSINSTVIDPKRLDERCLIDGTIHQDPDGGRYVILPPNSYLLGRTIEYFRMPRDVLVIALGKSTYARAGAIVNVTPIEPGFEGNVVIEISNSTPLPMKIYANEGISQFVFFQGSRPAAVTYADRDGKYQGQTGITLPKV